MNDSNKCLLGLDIPSLSQPLSYEIKHSPFKRMFDILFSCAALIICLPVFLIIAVALRSSSTGNVFYYQERLGRGGKTFRCYKFRSMYADAEARLQEILRNDPARCQEWEQTHKLKNDPRVTPVGSILRRTSLDELPQFWNVLLGDLSIVGPRPVVKEEVVKHFGYKAYKILSVRPGITGIWQVSGRSDTSYATRIALDEKYIDTRTFGLDLKLIALTIPCMISSKGAY